MILLYLIQFLYFQYIIFFRVVDSFWILVSRVANVGLTGTALFVSSVIESKLVLMKAMAAMKTIEKNLFNKVSHIY